MAHLIIRNIGAIKEVDIELNKINVIMGPQSSGKSTINKIACYCSWVEKKVSLDKSFDFFLKDTTFITELVRFHKLKGYIKSDSYIEYESKVVKFTYDHSLGIPVMEWKDSNAFKRTKISYIPSERNIVAVVPNWMEVKLVDNNTRSFMIDWSTARNAYQKDKPFDILNLGVKYYYDDSVDKDFVIINDNTTLELTNTSSGLQSIIPLVILIDYLTNWIYSNESPSSVIDLKNNEMIFSKELVDFLNRIMTESHNQNNRDVNTYIDLNNISKLNKIDFSKVMNEMNVRQNNLLKNNWTNLFIEEPEQNLFPSSQRDLMYYLLLAVKVNEDHKLLLTTHSPYILYALNNCMMGYLVKDNMPEEDRDALSCVDSFIDPKLVSIYEIKEGNLICIQESDGLISDNYFDSNMKAIMNDFYKMLNYYGDDKDEN